MSAKKIDMKAMRRSASKQQAGKRYLTQSAEDRQREKQAWEEHVQARNARLNAAARARSESQAKVDASRKERAEREAAAASALREAHGRAAELLCCEEQLSASPNTEVLAPPSRRARPAKRTRARPVWETSYEEEWSKSFLQLRAELPASVTQQPPPKEMAVDAFKDGLLVVQDQEGGTFSTCGLRACPFARRGPWQNMASELRVVLSGKKVSYVHPGGTGLEMVGAGTYNLVMRMSHGEGRFSLPDWLKDVVSAGLGRPAIQRDVVLRITRNDCEDFPELDTVAGEAHNAMFASMNAIGPPLFAVAPLAGVREGRTARYGSVQLLQAAQSDLGRALRRAVRREQGVEMGIELVELLWHASIRGVLFVDIKPGNVLCYEGAGGPVYKLADTDPQFFLRLDPEQRDWRALLLANLALLAAHVRNSEPASPAGEGLLSAVAPVLRELLRRRGEYASRWLFEARSVDVAFEAPLDHGDFCLQRVFCCMASSYFYGPAACGCPSAAWDRWDRQHQAALAGHWRTPANKACWPPAWARAYRPLVEQLVEFATGAL